MTDPAPAIRALIDGWYVQHRPQCAAVNVHTRDGGLVGHIIEACPGERPCDCGLETLLAGLPVPEPTQEWQSIDNPPPTAQTVLLSNGYNVSSGYFAATDRKPRWHDASLTDYGLPATVWMPTPDPPEPAQEQN